MLWAIFESAIGWLEPLLDLYLLCSLFPAKARCRIPLLPAACTCLLYYLTVEISSRCGFPYVIESSLVISICFGFLLLFREGSWVKKLFWLMAINAVFLSIAYAVTRIVSVLPDVDVDLIYTQTEYRIASVCLIHVLYILFVWIIVRAKYANETTGVSNMLAMIFISISNICVLLLIEYTHVFIQDELWKVISATVAIAMLATSLITLGLFTRFSKQEREMARLRIAAYYSDMQKRYLNEIERLYHQIRIWRHDYQHHMQTVLGMLSQNKVDEATKYAAQYLNDASIPKHFYSTECVMLDALLSSKLMRADAEGIEVKTQIVLPHKLPVSDIDLCALLGNLIDNAVEASAQVQGRRRYVDLSIMPVNGNLCIRISNSTVEKERVILSTIPSTKRDAHMHGFGLLSANAIIKAAHGYCTQEHKDYTFDTTVLLPMHII